MRSRLAIFVALVLSLAACSQDTRGERGSDDPERVKATQKRNADAPDRSKAPGDDDSNAPLQAGNQPSLRSSQIRTRHLSDASVTAGKIAYTAVTVNVNAAAATGSSAADPTLAGGILIACTPSGNQDQFLDNAVLNGDGSITLTLAANATAQNNFRCVAVRSNANGVQ